MSDGAKSDVGNIQELFSEDNVIAITDPVYPVYLDSNVMSGRTGEAVDGIFQKVVYLPTSAENNFSPEFPSERVDIVYLCSPNNPTGTVLSRARLAEWVKWCKDNDAILMFDSAYEAFISTEDTVKSIYEIESAREVAIEFRSFSKTAGFTGTRCAYAVVPKEVTGKTKIRVNAKPSILCGTAANALNSTVCLTSSNAVLKQFTLKRAENKHKQTLRTTKKMPASSKKV